MPEIEQGGGLPEQQPGSTDVAIPAPALEKELLNELTGCIQYLQKAEPDSTILPELQSITLRKQEQLPAIAGMPCLVM